IKNYKTDLSEGLVYIRHSILPHIIAGAVLINFFTGSMFASIPAFSLMQGGNEAYYGYYMVAMTIGLLIGSFLTPKIKQLPYSALTMGAALLSGIFWIGSAYFSVWYSLIFYCIGFIGVGVINILIFSIVQQQVEERMIGRVITILISLSAIGQLLVHYLGEPLVQLSVLFILLLWQELLWLFSVYIFSCILYYDHYSLLISSPYLKRLQVKEIYISVYPLIFLPLYLIL